MKQIEIKKTAVAGKVAVTLLTDPDIANDLFILAREKGVEVSVEKDALKEYQEEVKPTFESLLKEKVKQKTINKE
ncbi:MULTISPECIES: hypothetical protein [Serratia]|uniref:hypothetical protein n=1 Tax=Serratia TaxID=613 RepID=UPI0009F7CC80|nr:MULTISPECIES: hypothetical protein [Serratia]CAI1113670.1 Uncharacterised protein [Serratia quinivorans]CAI2073876.1 Uncharacterised protein [Serratia quinivorans]SMB37100.1 conserved hypothetical protein [Serratia proteamaculans]